MPIQKLPVDALIFPLGTFHGSTFDWTQEMKRRFGPIMGNRQMHLSFQGQFNFVTPVVGHTGVELLRPEGHPRAKEEAYVWFVLVLDGEDFTLADQCTSYADYPDQIKAGYRIPDQFADNLAVQKQVDRVLHAKAMQFNKPDVVRRRLGIMLEAGHIRTDEYEARLQALDDRKGQQVGRVLLPSVDVDAAIRRALDRPLIDAPDQPTITGPTPPVEAIPPPDEGPTRPEAQSPTAPVAAPAARDHIAESTRP